MREHPNPYLPFPRRFWIGAVSSSILVHAVAAVVVPNFGFESPVVGVGTFKYSPTGGSWTFSSGAGLSGNGSGFTSANSTAPQGAQVAFIQGTGQINQTLSGFASGVKYTVRFSAAQRNYSQPGQTWNLELDGKAVGQFAPPQSATGYSDYSASFTTSPGSHLVGFRGTLLNGGDCTVLLDNVRISGGPALPTAPDALAAVALATNRVELSWIDHATDETGFKIELRTIDGIYTQIATTPANTTAYSVTDLLPGTMYFFRVSATNGIGDSAYCAEACQTTPLPGVPVDYEGRPFVAQAAPNLTFLRKLAPSPGGIDYLFSEQTAQGVALLARFPGFTNQDKRVHVMGPWYSNNAANLHFTRGISTISTLPRYRLDDTLPASVRKLSPSQKWDIEGDPLFWSYAGQLADNLTGQNPADPRIGPLRTFANSHNFVADQSAFAELGRHIWNSERWPLDISGRHVRYFCADIELSGGFEHQRDCFGWIYQGMAQAAVSQGQVLVPLLYGQYQYSVNCFSDSTRQGGANTTNPPDYLLPDRDFLSSADPTLSICQDNSGILSMDGYVQAVWGHDPFFERETNGTLAISGGLPSYNTTTNGTAYGARYLLEPGEAKHCLDDLYRQALRMYLQWHRRAGAYPANSSMRKPFLTNTRIGAWTRYSNEGVLGIVQNDRPLPDWEMELLTGLYLFTADDFIAWSSDMNYVPGPLGGDYTSAWRYNTHGVLESVVKAAHRYSASGPLHTGPFNWCWFNLPVVNQNTTPGDRYFEKPLAIGKLRTFEGHTYLELFLAWPGLDGESKVFKVWIEKNGNRSSAYTARLANGRSYFYDAWQLPDDFTNLEGRDIVLRATDLAGVQRTWRGDWRAAVDNSIPIPADFPAPRVSITPQADRVMLDWDQPNFVLETAPAVFGPWAELNFTSPVAIPVTNGTGYFRLRE